jgi:tetratricopeptide (TPR) repeat protein
MALEKTDDTSLAVQITPDMPPRRVASLRLAEEGRKLLQAGEYQTGLSRLEKAIALDSGNPYAYYYLAVAHFHLSQYQQSLNFLEIVGPALADKPSWLSRVCALEGENYRALGLFERADRKYLDALTLDASNRVALAGLTSFPEDLAPPLR